MGTAVRTAKTSPVSWDAFADVDAFVDEVLAEGAEKARVVAQGTLERVWRAVGLR